MENPCNNCPYHLSEESKINLCSNPENNICKYWLRYQGWTEGNIEGYDRGYSDAGGIW